jgi:hypothetical protein
MENSTKEVLSRIDIQMMNEKRKRGEHYKPPPPTEEEQKEFDAILAGELFRFYDYKSRKSKVVNKTEYDENMKRLMLTAVWDWTEEELKLFRRPKKMPKRQRMRRMSEGWTERHLRKTYRLLHLETRLSIYCVHERSFIGTAWRTCYIKKLNVHPNINITSNLLSFV